jgi:hypothetical protein
VGADDGCALVEATAQTGTSPARYWPHGLDSYELRSAKVSDLERHILNHSLLTYRKRSGSSETIEIHDDLSAEEVLAKRSLDALHPLEARMLLAEQDWRSREGRPALRLRHT